MAALAISGVSAEEVTFPNAADDLTLAGEFVLPDGAGPHPAVILLSGSGAHNRDSQIGQHRPFARIAKAFAAAGLATLRYDDRGVGGSSGANTASLSDDARDAEAALDFLCTRAEVDPHRIGFLGHSAGALAAARVSNRRPGMAFTVLFAGAAVPGDTLLHVQIAAGMRAQGFSDGEIATNDERITALIAAARRGGDAVHDMVDRLAAESGASDEWKEQHAAMFGHPWLLDFINYDPVPAISALSMPTLALFGSTDTIVPVDGNMGPMRRALKSNSDAEIDVLEGHNHFFQDASPVVPYTEAGPMPTDRTLGTLVNWITQVGPSGRSPCREAVQ